MVGTMSSHLEPEQLASLHKALLRKGADLNEQLVQLLNGQGNQAALSTEPDAKPGETVIDRLRRFMAIVDSKIQASRPDSKTAYGRCENCGAPLSFAELEQLPWAERCRACTDVHHTGKSHR